MPVLSLISSVWLASGIALVRLDDAVWESSCVEAQELTERHGTALFVEQSFHSVRLLSVSPSVALNLARLHVFAFQEGSWPQLRIHRHEPRQPTRTVWLLVCRVVAGLYPEPGLRGASPQIGGRERDARGIGGLRRRTIPRSRQRASG